MNKTSKLEFLMYSMFNEFVDMAPSNYKDFASKLPESYNVKHSRYKKDIDENKGSEDFNYLFFQRFHKDKLFYPNFKKFMMETKKHKNVGTNKLKVKKFEEISLNEDVLNKLSGGYDKSAIEEIIQDYKDVKNDLWEKSDKTNQDVIKTALAAYKQAVMPMLNLESQYEIFDNVAQNFSMAHNAELMTTKEANTYVNSYFNVGEFEKYGIPKKWDVTNDKNRYKSISFKKRVSHKREQDKKHIRKMNKFFADSLGNLEYDISKNRKAHIDEKEETLEDELGNKTNSR